MREMKDSGIEWIGEIPAEWKNVRLGGLYSVRNTKVSDEDYPPLSVTMQGVVPQLETAAKSNDHNNRKLVKKGDFAINSRSDRRGSCGISSLDGSVSLINTVLVPREEMNPDYYNWLFHTIQFADEFYKWGHGIVDDLWTTGWSEMKKINVPVPSLFEQKKIADFLSRKYEKISLLYEQIQSQISTLESYRRSVITEAVTKGLDPNVEMKDSGIEWIGDIPANWTLIRMANIFSETNIPGKEGLPILMVSINSGVSDHEVSNEDRIKRVNRIEDVTKYKQVQPGDITYNMMRAWQGAIGTARVSGLVSPAYVTARPQVKLDSRYIEYLMRTPNAIEEMHKLSYGIMDFRLRLYWSQFRTIKVCLPPYEEQVAIADFADQKSKEIDAIIEQKRHQLDLLDQYKKSLIYEYVTGKKEVPADE